MVKNIPTFRFNSMNKYGWKRDLPDIRDRTSILKLPPENLPALVDLRPLCPPVLQQGDLGSCTANAIANAHYFDQLGEKKISPFLPSRLFIYYNERVIEHTVQSDAGASLRTGIKTLAKQGACPEITWPYETEKFTQRPNAGAYSEALKHQALNYSRIPQNLNLLKSCLASGYPFVFGFSVYEQFESSETARTGAASLPTWNEDMLGGHAVMAVGYDDAAMVFLIMNSWGERWGMKGFFTMPYEYMLNPNLAADFWVIRSVE